MLHGSKEMVYISVKQQYLSMQWQQITEFLVTYYTPEGGKVLDPFMGRATNGFACLEHGREFIGYDVFDKNVNRTQQVMEEYYPDSKFQLFHSDGTELAELKDNSEYLDGVVADPPYFLKAEKYSKDERDLSSMSSRRVYG